MSTALQTKQPRVGVRLRPATMTVIAVASLIGLFMFAWPLVIPMQPDAGQASATAPMFFALLLPIVVLVVLVEMTQGGMDTKSLAMLGVLSAINAALRPALGAGTAGIESVFFTLILAGRAFGPGFGFTLGCTSLFASALLTAGVGPWLPYQMVASAWIGMGAGLLPRRVTGKAEVAMLIGYGIVVSYLFGVLMNLWFWPSFTGMSAAGVEGSLDYIPGAPITDNLYRFVVFTLFTSTAGWDTGRAIVTSVALAILGRPVLQVLHRAARPFRVESQALRP